MSDPVHLAVFCGNYWQLTSIHWGDSAQLTLDMLHTYYNTPELARQLSDLGNLSVLGRKLGPALLERHNFRHPAHDVTIAYERDRGEVHSATRPLVFWTFEDIFKAGDFETIMVHYGPAEGLIVPTGRGWMAGHRLLGPSLLVSP